MEQKLIGSNLDINLGHIITSTPKNTNCVDPYEYLKGIKCEMPSEIKKKKGFKRYISFKVKEKANIFEQRHQNSKLKCNSFARGN